jgi:hypothetical protein
MANGNATQQVTITPDPPTGWTPVPEPRLPPGAKLVSGQVPMALPPGATLVSPPLRIVDSQPLPALSIVESRPLPSQSGAISSQPAPNGWTPVTITPDQPNPTINRYFQAGQGVQDFPAGSTDEQQFLQRFPQAKLVKSYQSPAAFPVSTETPEARTARETQAAKKGMVQAGAISAALGLSLLPETWPLAAKVGAAAGVGGLVGAAEGATEEHPSAKDTLKQVAENGLLYGGGELTGGLLGKAFGFLRSLRGISQAAKATAEEATPEVAEAAGAVAPKVPTAKPTLADMAKGPEVAPRVAPKPVTPTVPTEKPAGDVIAERLGIFDKDPQSLITSALKPTARNTNWAADMQRAFPDLKAAEAELGRPIKTFDDAKQAVTTAKTNIWSQYEAKMAQAKAFAPNAPSIATIDGNKVADAMMRSIDARTAAQNPALVQRITKVANTYRREMPIDEAEEFLQSANNELNSYYAKNKVGQQVAARDPETGHVVAEAGALRDALYKKLDELTGPGAADLKRRYGALSNFEDVLLKRQNVALRQQPESLAEQISKARAYAKIAVGIARMDPWAVYEGTQQSAAATWLKERQTSEAMMERAFANFGRPAAQSPGAFRVPRVPGAAAVSSAATAGSQEQ